MCYDCCFIHLLIIITHNNTLKDKQKISMLLVQKQPNTFQDSMKTKQFNTSALTVWAQQDYFYLQPNYSKSLIPTVLKINRKTLAITQIKSQEFTAPKTATPFYFSFFIGIINLNGKRIMMLSQQVQLVCTINRRDVFRITKPIFLFYNPKQKNTLNDQQARVLVNLMIIFEKGMYYSYAYNLTQPLHHIKKLENNKISGSFNWAQTLQNQLSHCNSMWALPVIQGFINKIQLYINAQKFRIILISRRSIKRGGPWQYNAGVAQTGNVANYVQTQQIFCVSDMLFSFVQVRGSVPIYWTQKFSYGMASNIVFHKNPQQNFTTFQQHITNMIKNRQYDNIILLNLLRKDASEQKKLIQNYQYLVRKTQKNKSLNLSPGTLSSSGKPSIGLHYYYYDVHQKCPNKDYKNLNQFITSQLYKIMQACGFTAVEIKSDKNYQILNIQKSVIRTNCGTCIDRTNITQSRLAAYQLVYILEHINININSFDYSLEFIQNDQAFATLYRNLWADNGDNISNQYAGTGSTQSYATRKGKLSYMTTIDHGLTSLMRAVRNIRQEDQQKNKTVSFLLKGFKSRERTQSQTVQEKQTQNQLKRSKSLIQQSKQKTKLDTLQIIQRQQSQKQVGKTNQITEDEKQQLIKQANTIN